MAWNKAHLGKPIWTASGGPELPLMYMAAATALGVTGPGRYSLDALFEIETPAVLVAATAAGVAAGVAVGILAQPEAAEAVPTTEEALAAEATGDGDAVQDVGA